MRKMTRRQDPLAELATRINAEHEQFELALRDGLMHARKAGELLLEAKGQVAHGQWLTWLKDNVRCSVRTCQVYMRVTQGWSQLEANTQGIAHLTIEGAMRLLAEADEAEALQEAATQAGGVVDPDLLRTMP